MEFLGETRRELDGSPLARIDGRYRRANGETFALSFVFPQRFTRDLTALSDPWFVLGATAAFAVSEDYAHAGDLCAGTHRNMAALTRQWAQMFPSRRSIALSVAGQLKERRPSDAPNGVGCFYTGGVDSNFTLSQNWDDIDATVSIPFDFAGDLEQAYWDGAAICPVIEGKENLLVASNMLRPFPEFGDAWSYLTHGPALLAVAHLFAPRFGKVYISSSYEYGQLIPWGSHPLTDPLLSSSQLEVVHYGATYSRYEKTAAIASDAKTAAQLIVCGKTPDVKKGALNCSRCQKCLRTMVAIDLAGAPKAPSFDWSAYSVEALAEARLYHRAEHLFFEELARVADAKGRGDIAGAARAAMARSRRFQLLAWLEGQVRRRFPTLASNAAVLKKLKNRLVRA